MESLSNSSLKYVGFSYHQNHQEFVLKIYSYLKNVNLPVRIDIQDEIHENIYPSTNGISENIGVLLCFLTPMYEASKHCQEEVELVQNKGIPLIGIRLLPNWKPSGWFKKITNDISTIDINSKNFDEKMEQLREKLIFLLDNNQKPIESSEDRTMLFDDLNMFSLIVNENEFYSKIPARNVGILPSKCRLNFSNLMICNNEYILIHGNNSLHLFNRNLKLIRSNKNLKISSNELKDLCWCSNWNSFLILTKKHVYSMNPLTSQLSIIENIKLKDQREEFISCSCSEDKFFVIICQFNSNLFYLEEYSFPTFRFMKKSSIIDQIGIDLFIQNGFWNENNIQQITSIRFDQQKIAIIMQISFQWFIYVFHFDEQLNFLTKIPLENKSRMTILNPMNQWIIFQDYLSNSFIQISADFKNQSNQNYQLEHYSKGFIHFNGKIRSLALFGISNLVLLVDDALIIYEL